MFRASEFESNAKASMTSAMLRRELSARSRHLAAERGLLHDLTTGITPSVIFGCDEAGQHGNFEPSSYQQILANPTWQRRLMKVHTGSRKAMPRADWRWMELDCANSSDALLMNIFCYPGVLEDGRVLSMLGVDPGAEPEFGYAPRVPLLGGKRKPIFDRTEVDLRLGNLLIEAKLTETNFQQATPRLLERYRDFPEVFDVSELPWRDGIVQGYQLIRGTLAAHATETNFCVLSHARRHDLIEAWYAVLRAVHLPNLRWRLKLLTWQELASVLPTGLQSFLSEKYGIVP